MAPDFSLQSTDGKRLSLKNFRGRKVVLYFYPEDDTPTCTKAGVWISGIYMSEFAAADAVVLGISPDDVTSHESFRDKVPIAVYFAGRSGP